MKYASHLSRIFWATLKVSFLSFGGGNAAMGVIEKEFVERYKLCKREEFFKILSLTNMFPGPLIINTVSLLGYKIAGLMGGILAFIIIVFPGPLILLGFVLFLHHYVSASTLLKIGYGITPVITAILLEFVLKSYKKNRETMKNKQFYGFIFFFVLALLCLGFNMALIFFILLISLWIVGFIKLSRALK